MVLSKREKILLYILALLVILLASWTYIINPVLNANRQAKLEYEAAQAEREQMEMLMPSPDRRRFPSFRRKNTRAVGQLLL